MIFVFCGMAASGKDTTVKALCGRMSPNGKCFVEKIRNVTTRPMRPTEDGSEYMFVDRKGFGELLDDGNLKFVRDYSTEQGHWSYGAYFVNQKGKNIVPTDEETTYAIILDPAGAAKFKNDWPEDVCIIMLMADTELRRERYLSRTDRTPKDFDEWHRRLTADNEDFVLSNFISDYVDYTIKVEKDTDVNNVVDGALNIILTEEWHRMNEKYGDESNDTAD